MKLSLLALSIGFLPVSLAAESSPERILVFGQGSSLQKSLGPSTYVIDSETIALKNAPSVYDYLKDVPGIYIQRTGGAGGQVSVFSRGAKQDQFVVTIDGVPLSDPSQTGGGFDLGQLSIADVASIEIFKGAQSVLYGSDGLGGIINIVTKSGSNRSKLRLEGGSNDHARLGITTTGRDENLSFRLNTEHWRKTAPSDADEGEGNSEKENYLRQMAGGQLAYNGSDWYSNLSFQLQKSSRDLDQFGDAGRFVDDPDFKVSESRQSMQAEIGRRWLDLSWAINLGLSNTRREYNDRVDPAHSFATESTYHGKTRFYGLSIGGDITANTEFSFGLQQKQEIGEVRTAFGGFKEKDGGSGAFFHFNGLIVDGLVYRLGVRRDNFQRSGVEDTGSLQIIWQNSWGDLYTNLGRAFKAPSLYQSFEPTYGNADLTAERSLTAEVGYRLDRGIAFLDIAFFQNEYLDLIDYSFATNAYFNVDGLTTTRGAEWSIGHIWRRHRLALSGSYLDMTKNQEPFQRRPQNSYNAQYSFKADAVSLGTTFNWVGQRQDFSGRLAAQQSTDIYANWQLTSLNLYTRIENVFDRKNTPVSGFSPTARNSVAGVEFIF